MIKIQKEEFNSEEEIQKIKKLHSSVGAVTSLLDMFEIITIIKMFNQ